MAVRARKSSSCWAVNVDAGCACELVSLLFVWSVDWLANVRSARTLVYHRVTIVVVVVVVVVWLGVGRVDAIVGVVQDGQGKDQQEKEEKEENDEWGGTADDDRNGRATVRMPLSRTVFGISAQVRSTVLANVSVWPLFFFVGFAIESPWSSCSDNL